MTEKGGVQSVERIFQLIEQLASHPAGASLQRLAQETGLAKSTVHRLLASLVSLGYAAQEPETGRYRLTLISTSSRRIACSAFSVLTE